MPEIEALLSSTNPQDGREWVALRAHCSWKTNAIKDKKVLGEPQLWYRINTCFIKKSDLETAKSGLLDKELRSPHIIHIPSTDNQRFLGEYPWHSCYDALIEWTECNEWERAQIKCRYHVLLVI